MQGIGDPLRHRLGLTDRQRLRHLLAEHDVQRRENQEADEECGEVDRRLRHAEGQEQRLEDRGDGWLADPAEAEGGHGDAELAAGQVGLDVAQHLLRQARAETVLTRHRVDAETLALYQREFGCDIKAVGCEQEDGEGEIEQRAVHRAPAFSLRKSVTTVAGTSLAMKALPMP